MSDTDERDPTKNEIARMHVMIDEIIMIFVRENADLNQLIKVVTAVTVRGFESIDDDIDPELHQAMVSYYANASTSAVNFLQSGVVPSTKADLIGGEHKDTVQ